MDSAQHYTAFVGSRKLASGEQRLVLRSIKLHLERGGNPVLIFDDSSGRQVEFDFSGSLEQVLAREASEPKAGPGRPKLGVVSREISLLPRHWEWLEKQPNGNSAALRRLVDEARKREPEKERARLAREAAAKFMWAMAGDLAGFEEASRALYAGDEKRLRTLMRRWPKDIRAHALKLLQGGAEERT
jgi:hypothetical protein